MKKQQKDTDMRIDLRRSKSGIKNSSERGEGRRRRRRGELLRGIR